MRKQMDKGKSVDNLKKVENKSVDNLKRAPPVQVQPEEDRPIVNNRFKKAQAMNDSTASVPQLSSRHNESRQSLNSGTRRRREDRKKTSPKESIRNETPLKNAIDDIPIPVVNKGQKTFEQLLEAELAKEASQNKTIEGSDMKKSFLKRKVESTAKKLNNSTAKKSYKYYVDNFQRDGPGPSVKKLNFDSSQTDI